MDTIEQTIWAAMLGALLTMLLAATADALKNNSLASWRGVAFVFVTGSAAILMTGFPENLLAINDERLLLPAKLALGPLGGALALAYLGIWLGTVEQDRLLAWVVHGGSAFQCLAAIVLALVTVWDLQIQTPHLIGASAVVNGIAVVLASAAALRGVSMGDHLAKGMVLACMCLAVMVFGLYAKGLHMPLGDGVWALTALATVGYFLIVTALTLQRNRTLHRLRKLARGVGDNDLVTGLPTGAVFVSKVDDALWRSSRSGHGGMVMAIWIANLYATTESSGRETEQEIRAVLTARLRRTIGFRHTVGIYHPRCFLLVVSATKDEKYARNMAFKTYAAFAAPMVVGAVQGVPVPFKPELGIGLVSVLAGDTVTTQIMDQAERLSQHAQLTQAQVLQAAYTADAVHLFDLP